MLQRHFLGHTKRFQQLAAVLAVLAIVAIGTLQLVGRHATTPHTAVNAARGSAKTLASRASPGSCKGALASSGCAASNNGTNSKGPTSGPMGQTGTWNLAFDDEFEKDTSLNLTKWIMCNPSFASSCVPYNDEQEIYNTTLPSNPNVNISGGALNLVATKQNGQISSGMVSTGPNVFGYNQPGYTGFQFTYGYVEVAVKLPKGDGFWPSVWLLPDENTYGPWPGSGEYDIFEVAGNDPTTVYMTEHDGENGGTGDQATDQVSDTSAGYHVFGFDWEPDHLAWYIDGIQARSMICTDAYAAANPAANCDSYRNPAAIKSYPFFINMNFSVGGNWSALDGAPDSSTPFPSTMSIEWIRVWQHPTT